MTMREGEGFLLEPNGSEVSPEAGAFWSNVL